MRVSHKLLSAWLAVVSVGLYQSQHDIKLILSVPFSPSSSAWFAPTVVVAYSPASTVVSTSVQKRQRRRRSQEYSPNQIRHQQPLEYLSSSHSLLTCRQASSSSSSLSDNLRRNYKQDHSFPKQQEQHHSTPPPPPQQQEQQEPEEDKNVVAGEITSSNPPPPTTTHNEDNHAAATDDPSSTSIATSISPADIPMTKKMRQLEKYKEKVLNMQLPQNQTYNFWEEEELSITSFNMDLHNLAIEDPQRAQDALEIMEELYEQDPDNPMFVQPNSASYTCVIEGWCYNSHFNYNSRNNNKNNRQQEQQRTETRDEAGDSDSDVYVDEEGDDSERNAPIMFNRNDAAQRAQDLLDIMEESCARNGRLCPNELTYILVCQQWAESHKDDLTGLKAQRAHDILARLRDAQQLQGSDGVDENSADDASSRAPRSTSSSSLPPKPSLKLYSIVLEGWCKRAGKIPHAMDRAEELLHEMEQSSISPSQNMTTVTSSDSRGRSTDSVAEPAPRVINTRIRPNVLTYTSILGGLARSREPDLATRAMDVLERMQRFGVEPDMVAYTSVLNCWAKAVSRQERQVAASKALQILQDMEDMYLNEEKYHVKPNVVTYATAIKAIGNSFDPNAPALCEQVLERMYNLTESGKINVAPNTGTYNAVITSLSNCGGPGSTTSKAQRLANVRRTESLLVDMIKRSRFQQETAVEPNIRTWGAVLRAWADSGQPDAGEQAERVLNRLQEWYDDGKTSVRPNVVCHTTVIRAWGRSAGTKGVSSKEAMDRIEKLLQKMEDMYEETLDPDIRPNKITYVTAIDAICRHCPKETVGSKVQGIVDRMMRLYGKGLGHDRPTRIVLNALINAWSKSSEPNAAPNAERIFQWMESQYKSGRDDFVKPDRVSLCCVLNAWANAAQFDPDAALRAQQILDYTESLSAEERGFRHSVVCHNICIKAWGRSRAPDSVERAEAILLKLEEQERELNDLRGSSSPGDDKTSPNDDEDSEEVDDLTTMSDIIVPDITTYSSVINCCAYYVGDEEGRRKALEVALRTFDKTLRYCEKNNNKKVAGSAAAGDGPNHIVYGTLFKAISKLVDQRNDKDQLMRQYFLQCCEHGQVDAFVLSQVRGGSSRELFRDLVLTPSSLRGKNADTLDVNALLKYVPSAWTRNVEQLSRAHHIM